MTIAVGTPLRVNLPGDSSVDDVEAAFAAAIMYVFMYDHTFRKNSMDQPGKVADPARGQLNRENE